MSQPFSGGTWCISQSTSWQGRTFLGTGKGAGGGGRPQSDGGAVSAEPQEAVMRCGSVRLGRERGISGGKVLRWVQRNFKGNRKNGGFDRYLG